jgi:hypothetical protein
VETGMVMSCLHLLVRLSVLHSLQAKTRGRLLVLIDLCEVGKAVLLGPYVASLVSAVGLTPRSGPGPSEVFSDSPVAHLS